MTSKTRTISDILGDKSKDSNPTQPEPDETSKTDRTEASKIEAPKIEAPKTAVEGKTEVERIRDVIEEVKEEKNDRAFRENHVENFDNSGNGVTDNKPLDWDREAPAGTVIYGTDAAIPSENAVVSGVVSTAVYAGENEFDDKGLSDVEEPPVEPPPVEPPPEEEIETPAKESERSVK
jgi:hypothetical protein